MSVMASETTDDATVCTTACLGWHQIKHQTDLHYCLCVRQTTGDWFIPCSVMRKAFPCHDVIKIFIFCDPRKTPSLKVSSFKKITLTLFFFYDTDMVLEEISSSHNDNCNVTDLTIQAPVVACRLVPFTCWVILNNSTTNTTPRIFCSDVL